MEYCKTQSARVKRNFRKLDAECKFVSSLGSDLNVIIYYLLGGLVSLRLVLLQLLTLAVFLPATAHAQWFGPKNLEDCVLDKMKGQQPNMLGVARAACLKQFPQEVLLTEEYVKSTWCETNADSIEACVTLKDGYKITKAEAVFSRSGCGTADSNSAPFDATAEAKLPTFGSTYKFPVSNADSYRCGRFLFYGYKRP